MKHRKMSVGGVLLSGMTRVISSGAMSFFTSDGDSITVGEGDDESIQGDHIRTVRQHTDSSTVREQGGRIGLAYYDVETTQVYMMMDSVENEDFTLLHRVIRQITPVTIILSSKQDDRLIKKLKGIVSSPSEVYELEDMLQFLPSIDFSIDICKRRILNLDLPSLPKHYTETERTLYISSMVPFDQLNMVRATGGLLKYLEKRRVGIELEEADARVPILDLKTFSLDDQLLLDDVAFCALQIFHKELHPSVYKSGQTSAKEGLSLFGIDL